MTPSDSACRSALSQPRLPAWRVRALVLSLAVVSMVLGALPAQAADPTNPIGGVRFESNLQLGGQALVLNGTGLRARLIFKAYVAALYLPQPASTADAVVALPGAKRLQIRMLFGVPAQEFIKAFHLGLERNLPAEQQAGLAERAARFDAMLRPLGELKNGDTVNLDFLPGQGLLFAVNGRQLGAPIPGEDFYGALLRVFVGEMVSDDRLRAGLLGKPG